MRCFEACDRGLVGFVPYFLLCWRRCGQAAVFICWCRIFFMHVMFGLVRELLNLGNANLIFVTASCKIYTWIWGQSIGSRVDLIAGALLSLWCGFGGGLLTKLPKLCCCDLGACSQGMTRWDGQYQLCFHIINLFHLSRLTESLPGCQQRLTEHWWTAHHGRMFVLDTCTSQFLVIWWFTTYELGLCEFLAWQ